MLKDSKTIDSKMGRQKSLFLRVSEDYKINYYISYSLRVLKSYSLLLQKVRLFSLYSNYLTNYLSYIRQLFKVTVGKALEGSLEGSFPSCLACPHTTGGVLNESCR
jgi:hypothetical protein